MNLDYEGVEHIVEELIRLKASSLTFDVFDVDDVAQEMRIICFKAIDKFDASKADDDKELELQIKNYLGRCIDFRMKNVKRDNYVRVDAKCEKDYASLDKEDKSAKAQYIRACWREHQSKIKAQLNIYHPVSISGPSVEGSIESMQNNVEYKDLENYVVSNAPVEIRDDIVDLLTGAKRRKGKSKMAQIERYLESILSEE